MNSGYTPKTKKIVYISSSEESDSDSENVTNNISTTPKRKLQKNKTDDSECSPPKQRKTPPATPSSSLAKLRLGTPKKTNDYKLLKKNLFASNNYSDARKALHSDVPENMIGREQEMSSLEDFIQDHLENKTSASLYISGPPGTGKTACLSQIMSKPKFKKLFTIVYVNCTTMKSTTAIYKKITEELNINTSKNTNNCKNVIEKYLAEKITKLLLVLDEIDQLEMKNQSVLYSIFEWPTVSKSQLLLIGIANSLDLTDRILPRLQAKCNLKPTLLHFKPYSKQQIIDIITKRLDEGNVRNLFSNTALQLLAGKIEAVSGDVRRALDICRRCIEMVESEKMMKVLQPIENGVDSKSVADKPVDFMEIRAVLNGVYGGSQNIDNEESTFPMQQKIILCSLMLILNKAKNKDVNIGRLHQVYKKVCNKRNMIAIDMSEFTSLCSLIETRGIFKLLVKKEPKLTKVNLQWDIDMLTNALQDNVLTSTIVNDASCL